jgi:tropomyosin
VRGDAAEAKVKALAQDHIQRDYEIQSLKNKLQRAEGDLEKAEDRITQTKSALDEGESTKTVGEGLMRKISLLESELDNAERNLRETTDK